jgi:hypothetical protein
MKNLAKIAAWIEIVTNRELWEVVVVCLAVAGGSVYLYHHLY